LAADSGGVTSLSGFQELRQQCSAGNHSCFPITGQALAEIIAFIEAQGMLREASEN